jgi:NADPH:quinone reductase-like Zn-dependent oxidoreductase
MRALVITRHGGPEVLKVRESADPAPGKGQVLLHVARAGLNFSDVMARAGMYPDAPKPPVAVGYEVAGTVAAVGEGVTRLRPGERVLAITRFWGHADRVVVDEVFATPIPEAMSFDHAAAIPVNYLTAYHMLFHVHWLKPGATVLLHMAAGGVGQAVVQLCRQVPGVKLFGTASASKHDQLREWGVAHPIDYRSVDYADEVRRLTGGRGVDLVLDPLGGPDWAKNHALLAPAGHHVIFGWANMLSGQKRNLLHMGSQLVRMKLFTPTALMSENRTVSGVNLGHLWDEGALLGGHLKSLLALYEQGNIAPHVDRVFPLSEGEQAHQFMQDRKNVGKLVFDCER